MLGCRDKKKENHRILLIVRWPVGGISTYLRYVYSQEHFEEYYFVVLVPDIDEIDILRDEMNCNNIEICASSISNGKYYRDIWRQILFGDYRIVHSHGFSSGLFSVIPAILSRKKHVMTAHDVFTEKQFQGAPGSIKHFLVDRFFRLVDIILPVSHGAEKNLFEYFPALRNTRKSSIQTIVNGIDVTRFKGKGVRNLHAELGIDKNIFLVGFMGRFMSQKGFKYLINAVENLVENVEVEKEFAVVAIGSGGFVREDILLVEQKGLKPYFYFLPTTRDVAQTLKGLDVLVMPSIWEACGLLAMEALVVGVPIIGSDCDGLGEVLNGSPAAKVKPRDVVGLAQQIKKHIDDNRLLEFEKYAPIAAKRYDVEKAASELKRVYNNLLNL